MRGSHIVIIGNGVAGNSAASAIRGVSEGSFITMISEEPSPEYSACVLSKRYISGEMKREEVFLKAFEDYSKENIRTIFGQKVTGLDIANKKVLLQKGGESYDKLIIATGANPVVPPIEGINKEGIFTLKSLEDADRISNYTGEKAVVIGAGPIGVEASISLRKRDWEVTLVELLGWVLPRAFDERPSLRLRKIIEGHGIRVLTGERAVKFNGDTHVRSVITDKREIECDMVILVLGVRPEVKLAQEAGIEIGNLRGIKVNRQMRTNVEDVYACGDCIQARDIITDEDILSLLWYNAKQQGEIAGYNSVGIKRFYPGAMNISGADILGTYAASIGHTADRFKDTGLKIIEGENEYYHRLLIAKGVVVGAQVIGNPTNVGPMVSAIRKGDSLQKLQNVIGNENLLFRNPWCYRIYPYIKEGGTYAKNNTSRSQ